MEKHHSIRGIISWAALAACLLLPMLSQAQVDSSVQKKKKPHPDIYRKGNFYGGLSLNYSSRDVNDLDLVVITLDELNSHGYGFRLDAGYFIKDKWAVGIMGSYNRKESDGIILNAGVPTQYRSAGEKYSFYLTMKNIFPLGAASRFSVFNYVKAGFSKRNKVTETVTNDQLTRVFNTYDNKEIRLHPGLAFNVIKGFNVELGINLAGIGVEHTETTTNGVLGQQTNHFSGNLSFNILSIDFGLYYYFGIPHKNGGHGK